MGMLLTGIVLGSYVLDWIDPSILSISPELRKIALIIILTRAGLSLDMSGLKKIGRPAMMAYTPKATVQAAIGGIPLSMGFALGAFAIDLSYKKFLKE